MKKMTQNQIQLLVILCMVVIVAVAYRFGYMRFDSQAKTIMLENQQLQVRLAELQQKEAQRTLYETDFADAKTQLDTIYSRYGTGISPEKSILFVNTLEQETGVEINNLSFAPETVIYSSTKLGEDGMPEVTLYNSQLSIDFTVSYDGLKACMDYINRYPERMNVESFNAVYDQETGLLKGAMIINQYSLVRKGTVSENPVVSDTPVGTDNIFGTIILPETN
ncbi:MAG: hypothetical protein H6Q59_3056 [Firmicutes bacterium]|nr:hypothetical protein [Bacillota bacterium]